MVLVELRLGAMWCGTIKGEISWGFSLIAQSNQSHQGDVMSSTLTELGCFQTRAQGCPWTQHTWPHLEHWVILCWPWYCIKKSFIWHLFWATGSALWFGVLSQWDKHCRTRRDRSLFKQCIKEPFPCSFSPLSEGDSPHLSGWSWAPDPVWLTQQWAHMIERVALRLMNKPWWTQPANCIKEKISHTFVLHFWLNSRHIS